MTKIENTVIKNKVPSYKYSYSCDNHLSCFGWMPSCWCGSQVVVGRYGQKFESKNCLV